MSKIIIITPEELTDLIREAVNSAFDAREPKNERTYSINAVAQMLHRSHETINKLVKSGAIKSTPDGKITQSSIDKFLTS